MVGIWSAIQPATDVLASVLTRGREQVLVKRIASASVLHRIVSLIRLSNVERCIHSYITHGPWETSKHCSLIEVYNQSQSGTSLSKFTSTPGNIHHLSSSVALCLIAAASFSPSSQSRILSHCHHIPLNSRNKEPLHDRSNYHRRANHHTENDIDNINSPVDWNLRKGENDNKADNKLAE